MYKWMMINAALYIATDEISAVYDRCSLIFISNKEYGSNSSLTEFWLEELCGIMRPKSCYWRIFQRGCSAKGMNI